MDLYGKTVPWNTGHLGKAPESQTAYGDTSHYLQKNPFHNLDMGDQESALGDDRRCATSFI